LLRGARQLVTLRGEHRPRRGAEMSALGIIQDGALLIVDGIIREVGPGRRVERLSEARGAEEVDASGKVVLPGFVDCRTQLLHPIAAPEAFEARCREGQAAVDPEANSSAHLRAISAQRLDTEARRRLRHFLLQGTLTVAASAGLDQDARATVKALKVLAALDGDPLRVCRTGLATAMSSVDTSVHVECPAVDAFQGRMPAGLRAYIDSGGALALGSGYGVNGSPVLSLVTVMSLACLELRLTPAEALVAVTINAAFAMGAAKLAGSLAPGKSADLLLLEAGDYREIVMQPGTNLIHTRMLRGEYRHARKPAGAESRVIPSSLGRVIRVS
jgi:imidazolonepropionase-like amidohydrolase